MYGNFMKFFSFLEDYFCHTEKVLKKQSWKETGESRRHFYDGWAKNNHALFFSLGYVTVAQYSILEISETMPRMLCNKNGAISHLQTEMGFGEDFRYSS